MVFSQNFPGVGIFIFWHFEYIIEGINLHIIFQDHLSSEFSILKKESEKNHKKELSITYYNENISHIL
jgi:hypothetical protein